MKRLLPHLAVALLLTGFGSAALAQRTIGKNPGDIKGRWLRIYDDAALSGAQSVYLGDIEADIQWKKAKNENPFDEDLLVEKTQKEFSRRLRESGALGNFLDSSSGAGAGTIRLETTIEVDPGSRLARYAVGVGAGKSRSVMEIKLVDHASGKEIALFHGYGTGSGMGFKLAGGGARKMTEDDIEEFAKKLVELIDEAN